ncbi:unnamed protein product [Clonostachys chloroleuca]|uniref:Nucleotide sugar dehydrogenase n=1 Tax=Clonostachys chloroleuca TaxID=1926264 RepID=A0AA35Q7Z3_9HYPO|nr:unnamed protein product [Clonostachys chloroleuca]
MAQISGPKIKTEPRDSTAGFPLTPPQESSLWGHLDEDFYPKAHTQITTSNATATEIVPSSFSVCPHGNPIVAVIGVGYVGAHLTSCFSSQYRVIGFDISEKRVHDLRYEYRHNNAVQFSKNPGDLTQATHFLISVPTLLRPDKTIDSSYLRDALKTVGMVARRGSTVVIESSVAVGMTRQLLGPLAGSRGFFAGMSPERVDPGRVEPPTQSIPKIISGLDDLVPGSLDAINRIYSTIFDKIVSVSKPEVAEMMKLYENCQRMVCIAYANEMADACIPFGIDPFEVCEAASTKPFGYMPYTPGVGVGGHCIPVNPFYLLSNSAFPLLESSVKAMQSRPAMLAQRVLTSLRMRNVNGSRPRVLVVGIGFKTGQSNLDNSPGADLARNLAVSREVEVYWADTLVEQDSLPQIPRLSDNDWCRRVLMSFHVIIMTSRQQSMSFDVLDELEGVQVERWYR